MSSSNKQAHYDLILKYKATRNPDFLVQYYVSPEYTHIYSGGMKYKWHRKYQIIRNIIGTGKNYSILDVGCATRSLAESCLRACGQYYGFDINPDFKPEFVGDAHKLSEAVDRSFDWVLLSDILEHVHDPLAVLRESAQVGHHIVIVVPQWYHLECLPLPQSWRHSRDRHLHVGGARFWVPMVEQSGLRVEFTRGYWYVPSLAFNLEVEILLRIDSFLDRNAVLLWIDRAMIDRVSRWPLIRKMGQELIIKAVPR